MSDLDEGTVVEVGGWDERFAVVRAVRTLGDRAAALVDANGDGADMNLEHLRREENAWELCSSVGGGGDWGRSWYAGLWAEHCRDEHGWRLTLEPGPLRTTGSRRGGIRRRMGGSRTFRVIDVVDGDCRGPSMHTPRAPT